jgi:hypothetical protein
MHHNAIEKSQLMVKYARFKLRPYERKFGKADKQMGRDIVGVRVI